MIGLYNSHFLLQMNAIINNDFYTIDYILYNERGNYMIP